jgi:uncharacterized protein YhaN
VRFQSLDLIRYGAFTDRPVMLPAHSVDLHVLVGPNEAGKSTLRCAISDLLFGIPARTPFAFLHAYDDMCIGAVIEGEGTSSEVRRFKRNKQPLRAPDDRPFPDNFFAVHIGTATREFFESTFGLDHERLVQGGVAILEAKDDVARMLFQSASGLADFGKISDAFTQEADQLWAPRASDTREYYRALKLFQVASDQLKALTVRSKDWKEAQNAVEAAEQALAQADRRLLELATVRARLERIRRVAGPIEQRRQKLLERDALGPLTQMPPSADAELAKAESDLAAADSMIVQYDELIKKAESDAAAIVLDPTVLEHEANVELLAAECSRMRNHPVDMEKRASEIRVKQETVERICLDLGLGPTDNEELGKRIPPQLLRSRIIELAQGYGAIAATTATTAQQVEQKERDRADLGDELAKADVSEPAARLLAARTEARSLGDTQKRASELTGSVRSTHAALDVALRAVKPWSGTNRQLADLDVPDQAVAVDHQRELTKLGTRIEDLSAQLQDAERALQQKELEERQWKRARDPVTPEVLHQARDERNAIWTRVKAGLELPSAVAHEYEAKVDLADGVADRRYVGAKDVEQLETLRSAIEKQQQERKERAALIEEAKRQQQLVLDGWSQLMRSKGLQEVPADRLPIWLQARQAALDADGDLNEAQATEARYAAQVLKLREELCQALLESGVNSAQVSNAGLSGLLEIADRLVTAAEAGRKVHQALSTKFAAAQRDLQTLERAKVKSSETLQRWQEDWSARLTDAGLAKELEVQAATLALDAYSRLSATLGEIRELKVNRIDAMRQDLHELDQLARNITDAMAITEGAVAPQEISTALTSRLKQARGAQQLRQQLVKSASEHRQKREQAAIQRDSAMARLKPLFDRSGAKTVQELREAVMRSSAARALTTGIEMAERTVAESGDSMPLQALESEASSDDLGTIAARIDATITEQAQQQVTRDSLLLEKQESERHRAMIHGQDDAAIAEANRQAAIAQMSAAIDRYIKLRVSARMLRWAIDRYREEKQDPLLKRAGQIFATVTLGSYVGLTVDYDGDRPLLKGLRSDGKHVGVEGLSSGTRDQLFLALRIAALEQHLATGGKALPFIADDLFINFDDERAAASFSVLAELATRMQVIYLTHHTHLASIAKERVGSGLNVVVLSNRLPPQIYSGA